MTAWTVSALNPDGQRRRFAVTPFLELIVIVAAAVIIVATYFVIRTGAQTETLLSPPIVALLLVVNLLPGVALLVLLGRRVAMRRAARSPLGGRARLHVRLVALFSIIAAVPTFLVVIFASLLFQYGVQFWYSDQARGMIESATDVARTSYNQMLQRWQRETVQAADNISDNIVKYSTDQVAADFKVRQIYYRNFSDGIVFVYAPPRRFRKLLELNPDGISLDREVSDSNIRVLQRAPSITVVKGNRIFTVVPMPGTANVYLLTVAISDVGVMEAQSKRSLAVLSTYTEFLNRSRSLQLKFNAALLALSLLIIAIAVWIALEVADRLVRPIGALVGAAHLIATGDLTARVPNPSANDEIGTLANAFNQMTERLEAQTGALDSRRALIEAVMSGVTAGIISTARNGTIRLINASAIALLDNADENPAGKPLSAISLELAALIDSNERKAIVEIGTGPDARTLAVKVTRATEGPILTFDDITGQLLDQRRAAWSDVARRIAHEIKNPLTPIQLAAERLQRRYGKQVATTDDGTFARLTDTIVRQVGDLRRMVDEFSSFARMPKPVFRSEALVEIVRQTLFLHEVAHPGIAFTFDYVEPAPALVCDRRQIGQALTNIVKNAVEAIEANVDGAAAAVAVTLGEAEGMTIVTVADTGIGLPAARDRIVEPYVTTRARGTGLGLAIVKKIVEEHFGTMVFSDREGGGTVVTLSFNTAMLAALDDGDGAPAPLRTPELSQNRN